MKKETIVTAVIFLAVGFLAGYITEAQMGWSTRQIAPQAAAPSTEMPPPATTAPDPANSAANQQGLPAGHPPIDSGAVVQQMEEEATQNPKDADIRLKLADFLYDQKDYSKAIQWYEQALDLTPKDINARTDLGTAFFYLGRPQDALREYNQVLEINPRHEPTLVNSIVVNLEGTHDVAAAQKAWDRLYQINPNHPALASLKDQINAARGSDSATGSH